MDDGNLIVTIVIPARIVCVCICVYVDTCWYHILVLILVSYGFCGGVYVTGGTTIGTSVCVGAGLDVGFEKIYLNSRGFS